MDSPAMRAALAVSRALVFLFTTRTGLLALLCAAAILLFLRLAGAVRARRLLLAAGGKKGGWAEGCAAVFSELASITAWGFANVPTMLMSAAVLALAVALSGTVTRFADFMDLQERLREYSLALRNVEGRSRVARVECLDRSPASTSYRVQYYGPNQDEGPVAEETFSLPGRELYFDAIVLNFAYSGIESGERHNLAIPYRAFSELLPQAQGRRLAFTDAAGRPYFFSRQEDQVYGMSKEAFDRRIDEIMAMAADDETARRAGVLRSVYGNAVHKSLEKGQAFIVWTEQSGGLSIKDERSF